MRDTQVHEGPDAALPRATPLGASPDPAFDRVAALVRTVLDVPVALVSLVDQQGQVFPGAAGLPSPWSETRRTPLSHSFCQHVVRSREPLVIRDARAHPVLAQNLAVPEIGVVAYAGVPLVDVGGRVVGSLCAIGTEPRDWTDRDIALLVDLAAGCSAEIQLRSAVATATRAGQRAATLLEVSETLNRTDTVEDVAHAVQLLCRGRLQAVFGGVTLLDPKTQSLTYVDMSHLPAGVQAGFRHIARDARTPSAVVARTGQPMLFGSRAEVAMSYPAAGEAVRAAAGEASAYLPLQIGRETIGTLAILWPGQRAFDADEQALLGALGRYTAQACQRALLLGDRREVAKTLQLAMLPALPVLPWVQLAARYLPARRSDEVGGDWYDAYALPDGSLSVSVGDIAGHDTAAAAGMGEMRAMLRGITLTRHGRTGETLAALDDALRVVPPARYGTGVLASLTPVGEAGVRLEWTNAGHPHPILLEPGRAPEFLGTPPSAPFGMGFSPRRATHTRMLPPGSLLLLHTDGLVEESDPASDIDVRSDLVASLADTHRALPLGDLLVRVTAGLLGDAHEDDALLLAIRTT